MSVPTSLHLLLVHSPSLSLDNFILLYSLLVPTKLLFSLHALLTLTSSFFLTWQLSSDYIAINPKVFNYLKLPFLIYCHSGECKVLLGDRGIRVLWSKWDKAVKRMMWQEPCHGMNTVLGHNIWVLMWPHCQKRFLFSFLKFLEYCIKESPNSITPKKRIFSAFFQNLEREK